MSSAFIELRELLDELFDPDEFKNVLSESEDFEFLSSQLPLKCESKCEFWRITVRLLRRHALCRSEQFFDFLTELRPRHCQRINAVKARFIVDTPDDASKETASGPPPPPNGGEKDRAYRPIQPTIAPVQHSLPSGQRRLAAPEWAWQALIAVLMMAAPFGMATWTWRHQTARLLLLAIFIAAAVVCYAFNKREQAIVFRCWLFHLNTQNLSAAIALIALLALVGELLTEAKGTPAVPMPLNGDAPEPTPTPPVSAPAPTSSSEVDKASREVNTGQERSTSGPVATDSASPEQRPESREATCLQGSQPNAGKSTPVSDPRRGAAVVVQPIHHPKHGARNTVPRPKPRASNNQEPLVPP